MIEGNYPSPTGLSVTSLTAATKLALVPIIFSVTGYAGRRELVAIQIAGMARITLDLRMRASQGIFRVLVMIEVNRAPLDLVVAGLAFGAIPCGVHVLNPVAIDARGANPFVAFADMARGADDGAMCALKRELGLVVVERFDPRPCCLSMTVVARFPKATLVRIVRFVTVEAASGRVTEFYRLSVTAVTPHGFMRVAQFEICKGVVERFTIELDDIGVSSLVIGVAMGAFLLSRVRLPPVKSFGRRPIGSNVLVTCQT